YSFSASSAVRGENSKSTVTTSLEGLGMSARAESRQPFEAGDDEPLDGGGQLLLVWVVVPSLAVAPQVVAHDRGHLEPAERVEPGQVRQWRPLTGVTVDELVGAGQAGHLAPDPGKVRAVGEDKE